MTIIERYASVLDRIHDAAETVGRDLAEITLVAVTKTWPVSTVEEAFAAGIRNVGENRAEELAAKRKEFEPGLIDRGDLKWHAIGALQSRKTNMVADFADVFHALDRLRIARRLSNRLIENGRVDERPLPVFLEVNISGETSKAGIDCSNWENNSEQREELLATATAVTTLPGLVPQGLMTMAPWRAEENFIRYVFARTRLLSEWLAGTDVEGNWSKLSMGMTDDFELAIEEGATHVRVGRAIFGNRR
jgi:pyridoxal phosphate enzyme (YggS family)